MRSLILFFMLISGRTWAVPDCDFTLTLSNAVLNIQDSTQVIQQPFVIRREGPDNGKCEAYRLYFSKGSSNSYQRRAYKTNGSSIEYNLHSNIIQIGTLKQFGDAFLITEFIQGNSPTPKQNYNGRFYISLPGLNTQDADEGGTYYDNVQVSVYGYNPQRGTYLLDTVETFTITIIIPTKINVSVVDEGGSFDASSTTKVLNFGYLTANQEKAADIRIVSNTSYRVQLSSQNNGSLKHSSSSSTITYQMKINGMNVGLNGSQSSPVTVGTGNRTGSSGDRYNTKVTITGSTENKATGTYQDVITITAIAN